MPTTGRYLYGLIRSAVDHDFGPIGLEQNGQNGRVHTLREGTVAAVVSNYSKKDKILPIRKNLEPHNRVIREVMKTTTIIPMTFGQVARNSEDVRKMIRRNRENITEELDLVDGKVEMSLKVVWDVDNIFEHFVGLDPELAIVRDRIFGRSHSPSHSEKMELGRKFEDRLNLEREEMTDRLVESFRQKVNDVKISPPKNEKMVMDLSFLVEREGLKEFEESVYLVAESFPSHFLFDFRGPWAPFNFVELDLEFATT